MSSVSVVVQASIEINYCDLNGSLVDVMLTLSCNGTLPQSQTYSVRSKEKNNRKKFLH
jgi:hypothetical protein